MKVYELVEALNDADAEAEIVVIDDDDDIISFELIDVDATQAALVIVRNLYR